MKIIEISMDSLEGLVDITDAIRRYVRDVGLKEGLVHIQIPERTCAVTSFVNNAKNIDKDFLNKINHLLPKYDGMQFTGWNTVSIKAALIGKTLQIMVEGGELILGLHESIYAVEFGGPSKNRKVLISHLGSLLAEGELPEFPKELAEAYQKELDAELAKKQEEERIIAEMRAEAQERARQYKESQKNNDSN